MKHPKKRAQEAHPDNSKGVKWVLIVLSATIGLTVEQLSPGWGRAVLLTLLVFGGIVFFGKPYWNVRFWIVTVASFAAHGAALLNFRKEINDLPALGLFFVAVIEVVTISFLLGSVLLDKVPAPSQK